MASPLQLIALLGKKISIVHYNCNCPCDKKRRCSSGLDLDRPPLLPALRTKCPLMYQRPTLDELRSGAARSYLLGGQQRPTCTQCAVSSRSPDRAFVRGR